MTETTMFSPASLALRDRIFSLEEEISVTSEEFDAAWPLVSCVYSVRTTKSQRNGEVLMKGGECRLKKSRVSSTSRPLEELQSGKRRPGTNRRPADQCQVTFRIDHDLTTGYVKMRRTNKDGSLHTHTMQASFDVKQPEILREICREEKKKGLPTTQILHAIRERAGEGSSGLKEIGVDTLKWHFINNTARGLAGYADKRALPRGYTEAQDINDAVKTLQSEGWMHSKFRVADRIFRQRWGLVFASPERLDILSRRGIFVQLDSSRKLNRWGHRMFSLLVRDECGTWIPTAHCVMEKDAVECAVAQALKVLRVWTRGHWNPRYIMSDSSIGRAVSLAFPGPLQVTHLLCTANSEKTLAWRLGVNGRARRAMRKAMWSTTKTGCAEAVCEAINAMARPEAQQYLRKEWLETSDQWAMYARQHNPLLLQITSVSSCVEWHLSLKRDQELGKGSTSIHGIHGMVKTVMSMAHKREAMALEAQQKFRTSYDPLHANREAHNAILGFPRPVQKLMAKEIAEVEQLLEDGTANDRVVVADTPPPDGGPLEPKANCSCRFSRQYLLPCRHIFQLNLDMNGTLLDDVQWGIYQSLFAGGGFQVYETRQPYRLKKPEPSPIMASMLECEQKLRHQFTAIHTHLEHSGLESQQQWAIMSSWMQQVRATVEGPLGERPENLILRGLPELLRREEN